MRICASLYSIFEKWKEENNKLKKTKAIAEAADFSELTVGYTHRYYDIDMHGMRVGEEKEEFVEMDLPRPCSYNKKHYWNHRTKKWNSTAVLLGAPISVSSTLSSPKDGVFPPVEVRGITLRQLRAVMANIKKRCVVEQWIGLNGRELSPKTVTLCDADMYVIRPFTVQRQKSFVTCLPSTAGPQPPRFFASHWWEEPVHDFVACLEQFVRDFNLNLDDQDDSRGGGMTADTPIWICAYANNHWAPDEDITMDPNASGITKAMEVAEGRAITILDTEGKVFMSIWSIFKFFLNLADNIPNPDPEIQSLIGRPETKKGLWAVYTAHTHKYRGTEERDALGIISGGATCDQGQAFSIIFREKYFPFELMKKSLTIQVEDALASEEDDRVQILNSIIENIGSEYNNGPIAVHKKYAALNNTLSGTFTASEPTLEVAFGKGNEDWEKMLLAISKRTMERMNFDFGSDGFWSGLNAVQTQLVAHLPLTLENFHIYKAEFGAKFTEALIQWINQSKNLKYLIIEDNSMGGDERGQEAGVRLAEVLSSNRTIERLILKNTDLIGAQNVKQWGDAFVENKTLKKVILLGVGGEIEVQLRMTTKHRTPELTVI